MPSTSRPAGFHTPWPGKVEVDNGVNSDGGESGEGRLGGVVVVVDVVASDDAVFKGSFELEVDFPLVLLAVKLGEVEQLAAIIATHAITANLYCSKIFFIGRCASVLQRLKWFGSGSLSSNCLFVNSTDGT